MDKIKKIWEMLEKVICILLGIGLFLFLVQLFCYTSFKIPSDSMAPTLRAGDRIWVNKMMKGARLFDVFAALENKQVSICRMPGWGNFKRNDVLVFNFPYQVSRWDSIRMDVMQYYVKRCIGLPGDTLEIRKGYYQIKNCIDTLGHYFAQQYLSNLKTSEQKGIVMDAFPYDETLGWTILEFGPLPIPRKGQTVLMNRTNFLLYRQLIDWEQKKKLRLEDRQILLGDSLITQYRFEKNYYFVSGDNLINSQDSRYWGMLPEEYIVGKATRIWNSEDRITKEIRWDRVMKRIR